MAAAAAAAAAAVVALEYVVRRSVSNRKQSIDGSSFFCVRLRLAVT